ncbi:MAG TPA: N-acetyl-gamma-glutamyl-phosphate reductase, partial [Paludibacteraceae bacterium]|nr:N-acetyl-gamma-glutamyl-phosphate reductase [Paludibacteraceae bacterium]
MKKIKVGIVGGAGYTAGELIRILIYHPEVEIIFIHSKSKAGKQVTEIHSGLIGETDLQFTSELPFEKIEVLFLCLAHGESKQFIETNKIPTEIKLIDFSADFRLDMHSNFVYGLPELQAE